MFLLCRDIDAGRQPPSLLSTANDKADLFCDRYRMLYQRTSRHKLFTPPILGKFVSSRIANKTISFDFLIFYFSAYIARFSSSSK